VHGHRLCADAQRDETRSWWAYSGAKLLFITGQLCLRRGLNDFFQRPQPNLENRAVLVLAALAFAGLGSTAESGPWRVIVVCMAAAYVMARMLMDARQAVLAEFGRRALWLLFTPAGLMLANCVLHVMRQALYMGHALELHRSSRQAYGALASFLVVGAVFNVGFTGLLIMRLVRRQRLTSEPPPAGTARRGRTHRPTGPLHLHCTRCTLRPTPSGAAHAGRCRCCWPAWA
jgi:hypothetical protein